MLLYKVTFHGKIIKFKAEGLRLRLRKVFNINTKRYFVIYDFIIGLMSTIVQNLRMRPEVIN
jgi:hypothetical protein